jgi:hypothetical protein
VRIWLVERVASAGDAGFARGVPPPVPPRRRDPLTLLSRAPHRSDAQRDETCADRSGEVQRPRPAGAGVDAAFGANCERAKDCGKEYVPPGAARDADGDVEGGEKPAPN